MRPATTEILVGDNRDTLRTLPDNHFHVCATSPPYWNLRDYGRGNKWEGGNDPNCKHGELDPKDEAAIAAQIAKNPGSTLASKNGSRTQAITMIERQTLKKDVCELCGARRASKWRGGDANCDHDSVKPSRRNPDSSGLGGGKGSIKINEAFGDVCGKCGAERVDRQLGREKTPAEYVANLVAVFREVRRVLRDDGILFVNLGDTYASGGGHSGQGKTSQRKGRGNVDDQNHSPTRVPEGFRNKELIGIPWRFAIAMHEDGWILRQELVWAKAIAFGESHAETVRANVAAVARRKGLSETTVAELVEAVTPQIGACMPQSCDDRCTTSHEHVFMFVKRPDYYADMEAVKETAVCLDDPRQGMGRLLSNGKRTGEDGTGQRAFISMEKSRNLRTVWTINPDEPLMKLRDDLSPEQRARAIQVLTDRGLL